MKMLVKGATKALLSFFQMVCCADFVLICSVATIVVSLVLAVACKAR